MRTFPVVASIALASVLVLACRGGSTGPEEPAPAIGDRVVAVRQLCVLTGFTAATRNQPPVQTSGGGCLRRPTGYRITATWWEVTVQTPAGTTYTAEAPFEPRPNVGDRWR